MPNRGMLRDLLMSDDEWARQRRLLLLLAVLVFGGVIIYTIVWAWVMYLLTRALGVMAWIV